MKGKRRLHINMDKQKNRFSLTLLLTAVVFAVLLVAVGLAAVLVALLLWLGAFEGHADELRIPHIILVMSLISLVMGAGIVMALGRFPLKPIIKLVNGMNSLAAGNYKTRIAYKGSLANHPTFSEITTSFNTLAAELENTEVLRSDFINNFSHEFKTPIVSIAGFAKLLKRGNLTEEQKRQYLDAIEEESMRLSYMATNVLNMTKVENQTILTDVTRFNLSEQVRSAVLLLEGKWSKKNIDLQLDFDEYFIEANEELLKHVWINLVDNAVKFVPAGGIVALEVAARDGELAVTVSNTGPEIPRDKQQRIFNKFYQLDESHAQEGNGIGLAMVRKIVELHRGRVSVQSEEGVTAFTVVLPQIDPQRLRKESL